jgi:hypothetical protein
VPGPGFPAPLQLEKAMKCAVKLGATNGFTKICANPTTGTEIFPDLGGIVSSQTATGTSELDVSNGVCAPGGRYLPTET